MFPILKRRLFLQKRRFGRTGLQVSIVGFGGTWISEISAGEAKRVVRRAFDLGINYFDTAKLDGDSEEKIGAALKDVRDEAILATKTGSRTKRKSLEDVKSSLRRLKTNRLNLIQLQWNRQRKNADEGNRPRWLTADMQRGTFQRLGRLHRHHKPQTTRFG
jgi:aryl-alcohol dehydrogenase-like predicted oxidoreductase